MNLFVKSYKIFLFFFLVGLLKYPVLLGQDSESSLSLIPETIEFEIPSKYNKAPNTSFCRNDNGVYFIGKENGLLIVDAGKTYFTPANAPVYIAHANNNIYYLTENDFGVLEYSPPTGPRMRSRREMLVVHFPDFYPAGILTQDSLAFLATTEGVFVLSENKAEHIFFNRQEIQLFNSGKHVFLQAKNMGLFQWDGQEFILITISNDFFKGRYRGIEV
jgi:hypothetical protein